MNGKMQAKRYDPIQKPSTPPTSYTGLVRL